MLRPLCLQCQGEASADFTHQSSLCLCTAQTGFTALRPMLCDQAHVGNIRKEDHGLHDRYIGTGDATMHAVRIGRKGRNQ